MLDKATCVHYWPPQITWVINPTNLLCVYNPQSPVNHSWSSGLYSVYSTVKVVKSPHLKMNFQIHILIWRMDSCFCSQRSTTAPVCGREERSRSEARSTVPGPRQSGAVPDPCHCSHTQATRQGFPKQERSSIVYITSCPRGHPAPGTQHRASG